MFARYKDLIGGILFLLFSIAYFYGSLDVKIVASVSEGISARTVPQVLAVGVGILSILQILSGVRACKNIREEGKEAEAFFTKRILLTILLIMSYIALMEEIGFLITTIFYLFLQTLLLMPKENLVRRNILISAVLSVAFAAMVYGIFVYGLTLMLPGGILD